MSFLASRSIGHLSPGKMGFLKYLGNVKASCTKGLVTKEEKGSFLIP
jgi:hypothetical protein